MSSAQSSVSEQTRPAAANGEQQVKRLPEPDPHTIVEEEEDEEEELLLHHARKSSLPVKVDIEYVMTTTTTTTVEPGTVPAEGLSTCTISCASPGVDTNEFVVDESTDDVHSDEGCKVMFSRAGEFSGEGPEEPEDEKRVIKSAVAPPASKGNNAGLQIGERIETPPRHCVPK